MADVYGLIPAAGRGERLGLKVPKQLHELAGRPMLDWTLERLRRAGVVDLTVALPGEHLERAASLLPASPTVRLLAGGSSRQESVRRCLAACPARARDIVMVHDGARALVSPEDVAATLRAARRADGAVLGRPISDTLKEVAGEEVQRTLSREGLFRAETPQAFRRSVLEQAFERAAAEGFEGTDDASLVERLGGMRIAAVRARWPNPKITWEADLRLAECLLASS
jgi:2-C-methyl-D-erythritol 4-phosphate cytidylyltransferase